MYMIDIVEEDEALRDLMRYVLEDAFSGSLVETATTGCAFLARWQTRRPDVILLDVMLPDMTGVALYHRLRQEAHLADVPVLFVTTVPHLMPQEGVPGTCACLAMPFGVEVLVDRVRTLLGAGVQSLALSA